ncbi:MAG: hypothetical protein DCF15_05925 [Phormidesmis priestleyi]|uniref:DUF5671 domain-containing protein n=1 Tax=Phormidesmis priestleyi TaxID=268141 RepID=A0A2W4XPA3_9CYAN|nr:MAG: hypothetical protein DCF15_05925 [Phormidesmis priestleyi]
MTRLSENPPPASASDIVTFIERARDRGASDEFISQLLRQFGWPQRDVERAFFQVYERLTGYPMPAPPAGGGELAKDAFFYLLSFVLLGLWTFSVGEIAFIWIDRVVPDATQNGYYNDDPFRLAFGLARLIVAYPVYLWLMRGLNRELARHREKHFSGVRKWLTYLTLLIVSLIGIGTLIAFLTSFLRGELTTRFILKAIVVLVIDGGILLYYLNWLQRTPSRSGAIAGVNP